MSFLLFSIFLGYHHGTYMFFKTYCLGYLVTCPVTGYSGNGNCPADALVDDLDGKLLAMMRLMFHQPVE
jgi:hypothetical protein